MNKKNIIFIGTEIGKLSELDSSEWMQITSPVSIRNITETIANDKTDSKYFMQVVTIDNNIQGHNEAIEESDVPDLIDLGLDPKYEHGICEKDIELVMHQTKVEKEKALESLIKAKGDVVEAIMALTT